MHQYMLGAIKLESISAAEHLGGVLVDLHKLDMNQPCAFPARMNNCIFVCLRRNVARSFRVTLSLYRTLESPQLEFVSRSGPPIQKTNKLERDQQKAPGMIKGLECFPYEERLNKLEPLKSA